MPKLFRDHTLPALCLFLCRAEFLRPGEVEGGQWYDFAAGSCTCGAIFAHDPTARNGGAVFLQALLMAADRVMFRQATQTRGWLFFIFGELHAPGHDRQLRLLHL